MVLMDLQESSPRVLLVDLLLSLAGDAAHPCDAPSGDLRVWRMLGTMSVQVSCTNIWSEYVSACLRDHPRATRIDCLPGVPVSAVVACADDSPM